jgi:tetratricopeptide (TPR) repeat protein
MESLKVECYNLFWRFSKMQEIIQIATDANKLFAQGKYKEALSLYFVVLSKDLNNSVNYCNIGIVYEIFSEFELAIAFYKKAIDLNDKNIRAINNLARVFIDIVKDYDTASKYLDYTIKISPNDAEAYNTYGNLYFIKEDYKKSKMYFNKSIFLDENFFKNYYDIAKVYIKTEEKTKAKEKLEKCLELNPNFSPAKDLLQSII